MPDRGLLVSGISPTTVCHFGFPFSLALLNSRSSPLKTLSLTCSISQYVDKYSAAYWGTSFVREMGKLNPEEEMKHLQSSA
jgi:hypothetical protein